MAVCLSVYLSVCYNREHRPYLFSENKKCKKNTFADYNIRDRIASLRKLYSMTLTHFTKVKDSNRDLPTAANAHSSVTSASTAALRVVRHKLTTAANAHSGVTSVSSNLVKAIFAAKQIANQLDVACATSSWLDTP